MSRLLLICEAPGSTLNSLAEILVKTPAILLDELRAVEIGSGGLSNDIEQKHAKELIA